MPEGTCVCSVYFPYSEEIRAQVTEIPTQMAGCSQRLSLNKPESVLVVLRALSSSLEVVMACWTRKAPVSANFSSVFQKLITLAEFCTPCEWRSEPEAYRYRTSILPSGKHRAQWHALFSPCFSRLCVRVVRRGQAAWGLKRRWAKAFP